LRNTSWYRPQPRKVEPSCAIEKEFLLKKQDEPVIIVEISEEAEKKLLKKYYVIPERRHKLSIWV
jgi:SET domain-containing protein